jgi:hypothetical protein
MSQGPRVRLDVMCIGCDHLEGTPYRCQSDSGVDWKCKATGKNLDFSAETPKWCPFYPSLLAGMIK